MILGLLTWLGAGLLAFTAARLLSRHRQSWPRELVVALLLSLCAGVVATALDFGGWAEPDIRAFLFAALVAFAAIATLRLLRMIGDR
jgi:hypothetical protein